MGREFEIVAETEIDGTPQQVFDAATAGTSGWLWPMEMEPGLGGAGPFGSVVTAWEPPHHYANHVDGENGFFNHLDYLIEERAGGRSWLRYVHSGVIFDDWDNQYDGARRHTEFYQHTLGEYVKHFSGRQAAFADVQGPAASGSPEAFETLRSSLGVDGAVQGGAVRALGPDGAALEAVLDFSNENFIGLRTVDAMYRFFGRNAFGSVVGMTIHLFADGADAATEGARWQQWLDGLYASA
ncbi:ATPase [Arthrobacter sp. 35W]|uniref:ATPase n=1 Tax=Arthrobacter sp. 35W TaxID=1132441 RepID=UPI00041CFE25|nr:ATPase [Arthrobacter sp. 35W]